MASRNTSPEHVILPLGLRHDEMPPAGDQTTMHEEDGWIFSEQPGKGVTCIGRSSAPAAPYRIRHHYPSAG